MAVPPVCRVGRLPSITWTKPVRPPGYSLLTRHCLGVHSTRLKHRDAAPHSNSEVAKLRVTQHYASSSPAQKVSTIQSRQLPQLIIVPRSALGNSRWSVLTTVAGYIRMARDGSKLAVCLLVVVLLSPAARGARCVVSGGSRWRLDLAFSWARRAAMRAWTISCRRVLLTHTVSHQCIPPFRSHVRRRRRGDVPARGRPRAERQAAAAVAAARDDPRPRRRLHPGSAVLGECYMTTVGWQAWMRPPAPPCSLTSHPI
jgi:hypothetical protein